MTNEEAIFCERSYLGETNCRACAYYSTDTCKSREAHKMAIDALKVTSCSDREYIANIDKVIKDKYVIYWTGYNLGFKDGKNGNEKRECANTNFIISVPQTESCKNAISRQAVDKLKSDIMSWINSGNRGNADYFIVDKIEELVKNFNPPSVQPKAKTGWIPVSERLPGSHGEYQVTIQCEEGRYTSACYFDGNNTWHNDNRINHGRPYVTDKVIAWQEEPEPYKAESEDKG